MKKWFRFTLTETDTSYYVSESDAEHTAEEILEYYNDAEIKSALMNYNFYSYNPFELPLDTDYTLEIVETSENEVPDDVVFSYNELYYFTNNYEVVKEYYNSGHAASLSINGHIYEADTMCGFEEWYEYITEYNK